MIPNDSYAQIPGKDLGLKFYLKSTRGVLQVTCKQIESRGASATGELVLSPSQHPGTCCGKQLCLSHAALQPWAETPVPTRKLKETFFHLGNNLVAEHIQAAPGSLISVMLQAWTTTVQFMGCDKPGLYNRSPKEKMDVQLR